MLSFTIDFIINTCAISVNVRGEIPAFRKRMMYMLIYGMLLHVAHLSVCPHPCYAWHSRETHPVGPAIAEDVCYYNTTCLHMNEDHRCPHRYKHCMRADDEEFL